MFTSGTGGDQTWPPHTFMLVLASRGMFFLFLAQPEGLSYAQCGKLPSTTLGALPCWCSKLWTRCTRDCANFLCLPYKKYFDLFQCLQKICYPFLQLQKFCRPFYYQGPWFLQTFFLLWPFSWPFWATFTSQMYLNSILCQEFHDPNVHSLAQSILCQMHLENICASTQLCQTYSA